MSSGSLKIGRIFGIDIELHWIFILLMLLPLLAQAYYLFIILLLLFLCVLVHELSHSITAIKNGINVSKIILIPLGGLSVIDTTKAMSPRVEFNIAIVGPVMSLFLGGLFGILVIFTPSGMFTHLVQYLFQINILLGAFNLLPAFPMDGGRVLRSYIERRRNPFNATIITVRISKIIMALIMIGTVLFLTVNSSYSFSSKEFIFFITLITVLFLYSGAEAEKDAAILKRETEGVKLRGTVSKHFLLVNPDQRVSDLYSLVKSKKEYNILTKNEGRYLLVNIFEKNSKKRSGKVSDVTIPIPNIDSNTSIVDTLAAIESSDVRIAAVIEKRKLLGIVTAQQLQVLLSLHMMDKRKGE